MGTRWIIEGNINQRWPINTRGNVGEVFPEVITALGYHLGVIPAERAWRAAYDRLGIAASGDFSTDEPVIIGLYGGYCYLNLSYLRMMGVRAPGSSAEAIDVSFFGEGDPPPYTPKKGDKSLRSTLRILRTVLGALGTKALPDVVADSFRRAETFIADRPSLDAPDDELLAYMHSFPEAFEPVFGNHMETTALAAIVSGVLADAAAAAADPGLVTHLVGASGEVHSARYSQDLYEIAKVVRTQPTVNAAFDEGIEGLLDRLADSPEAAGFLASFGAFIEHHGHRGPNDWELSSRTWDNTPQLALLALDRMRVADNDLTPTTRLGDDEAKRAAAAAEVRPHLKRMDRMNFDKALKATKFWSQAREATRDRAVRDRFAAVETPFFISSQADVPTIEELEAEAADRALIPQAAAGDVLTGNAGSAGVARGRARIVMDPADALALEPGEVLIAPLTDPAWTPLFMPAAAVVVNVGALMSHAIIVSRELAIPCVVAVEGATDRIPNGAMVEVDGTAGTVTLLQD
ncbi:MAG: PEP-utilizing enzyme [Actinomycetota bacterium]|nr:PEP-utilizing enzyme [Actinomycetota bacterium]